MTIPKQNISGNRAGIYVRVSTTRQDEGFSPEAQIRTGTEYCESQNLEIVKVVKDVDWSGGWSIRPGLDELRDMAQAGEIDVVVVSVRDRLARGIQAQVLKEEFEDLGVSVAALDSRGDDTPEGQLADGVMDLFSGFEKKRIVKRMYGGKLERARSGEIVPTHTSNYGYAYSEDRTTYVVDEEKMAVVRRIFRMIGVEGMALRATKRTLEAEGVPSPSGTSRWCETTIKKFILDDSYRPYSFEELRGLLSPKVFLGLDPTKTYGVWWFNTRKNVTRPDVEVGPGGKRAYRKVRVTTKKPRKEHIAVPVPDSGVPLEWVESARESIRNNKKTKSKSPKVFELSGGLVRCAECGKVLQTYHRKEWRRKVPTNYFYYRCQTKVREGKDACTGPTSFRREDLDEMVWTFVETLLCTPDLLRRGLDEMVRQEERLFQNNPVAESNRWLKKAEECEKESNLLLDLYLKGKLNESTFDSKREEIESRNRYARAELEKAQRRGARLVSLRENRETLIEKYAEMTPEALRRLSPEQRQRVYRMMRLKVRIDAERTVFVGGRLIEMVNDEARNILENATGIALESGYLKSAGNTPQNTMRARLSVDVRDNPESSFIQTAPGVYGLKGFLIG